ncbi:hypothetical protein HJG60_011736 [Phyllostomus discolor]|uniref:Uncharacterized protein n=1 Tax=Phyllostomus discolor TaxID=89673 RepID=A0A833ZWF6_9CHIR|nr:hypothetical protein HJG60_011736 [Phyllostomus discolor]
MFLVNVPITQLGPESLTLRNYPAFPHTSLLVGWMMIVTTQNLCRTFYVPSIIQFLYMYYTYELIKLSLQPYVVVLLSPTYKGRTQLLLEFSFELHILLRATQASFLGMILLSRNAISWPTHEILLP